MGNEGGNKQSCDVSVSAAGDMALWKHTLCVCSQVSLSYILGGVFFSTIGAFQIKMNEASETHLFLIWLRNGKKISPTASPEERAEFSGVVPGADPIDFFLMFSSLPQC